MRNEDAMKRWKEREEEKWGRKERRDLSLSQNFKTLEITGAKLLRVCVERPRGTVAVAGMALSLSLCTATTATADTIIVIIIIIITAIKT